MLNLNLNIIGVGGLFGSGSAKSRGSNFKPEYDWDYSTFNVGVDAPEMTGTALGSFTINTGFSNAINITTNAGGKFNGPEDTAVTCSISGAGQWPITGSTTMSLFISAPGGNEYAPPFFFSTTVSGSEIEGTLAAASGSILSASFTGSKNFIYYVSGSIRHWKGNAYNSPINWKAYSTGSVTNGKTGSNNTVSFNITKEAGPVLVGPITLTGSANYFGTTYNDYAFNITASLTGSKDWYDDTYYVRTTMSLDIPEIAISLKSYATSSILSASFTASTNSPYNITASVSTSFTEPLQIQVYAVGGGGGGAYGGGSGGSVIGIGSGGGAAQITSASFFIIPNLPVAVTIGSGGKGGTSSTGSNGTKTTVNYWLGPNLIDGKVTLTANSGSGGQMNGPGGKSGDGFVGGAISSSGACPTIFYEGFGGGGGGTIENGGSGPTGGGGGQYLGGGGGITSALGLQNGSPTPLGFLGLTGRGGDGGYVVGNTFYAPTSATAYGGGGGGAAGNCTTTRVGGDGGDGITVVTHSGTTQKLSYSGTYTTAITGSTFYYYLVGNGNLTWVQS